MRAVSAALRAAIDSGERVIRSVFTVDWDADGVQGIDDMSRQVGGIGLNQSLESSLPTAVQVVPGAAVAELTAELERGNRFRYDVSVSLRGVTSNSSGSTTASTTIEVTRPPDAREGDVMLMAVFIAVGNVNIADNFTAYDITRGTNVPWVVMSVRGDGVSFGDPAYARVEGLLLSRRVGANEPQTYSINIPPRTNVTYVTGAVNIGNQDIIGITDFSTKGSDDTDTFTSVILPPVDVDLPGSMIVSFYAASSYLVSGSSFSPSTTADIEQVELATSRVGAPNVRMAVMTTAAPERGRNQKSATYTSSGSITSSVGFCIVLGPKLAGDEAQHAAWMMSELNPDSPYAGKLRVRRPVRWSLQFITADGFESVPMFTGFSTTSNGSSRSRVATIKALDNRETLRGTKRGVAIIAESPVSLDLATGQPYMPGLETTWFVSYLLITAFERSQMNGVFSYDGQNPLRNGRGYFASPLANKFSFLWAPMHGSLHPVVGSVIYAYTQNPAGARARAQFDPGPFVAATKMLSTGTSTLALWEDQTLGYYSQMWSDLNGQLAGRIQFWLRRGTDGYALIYNSDQADGLSILYTLWVEVNSTGTLSFNVQQPSVTRTITGPLIPGDNAWHFVSVHFNSVTGSVRFRVDSTNTDVAMSTWADAVPATIFDNITRMNVGHAVSIAELQLAGSYGSNSSAQTGIALTDAWANENFTPTAFIDKSDNRLDCIPFIDDNDDTFSIIATMAGVESAAFFFDADGYPHFRTARSNVSTTGQTVQKQITARRSLRDLSYESGVMQIANIVSVGYTKFLPIVNGEAYKPSGVLGINIGETITASVVLSGPTFGAPFYVMSANSESDGSGTDLSTFISINITPLNYGYSIEIFNFGPSIAYFIDALGQVSLTIFGSWMEPQTNAAVPVEYTDITSIRKYGEQPLPTITGTYWMQREDSAAALALTLLSDLADAKPVLTSVPIKGDPTLEFGDLVTIVDRNGLGVNGLFRITSKDPSHDPSGGFTQELVVRQAATVAYWDTNSWDDGTVWG